MALTSALALTAAPIVPSRQDASPLSGELPMDDCTNNKLDIHNSPHTTPTVHSSSLTAAHMAAASIVSPLRLYHVI
jgi:hypothetical protein